MTRNPSTARECAYCASPDLRPFTAVERMYGTGAEFLYTECGKCGRLELDDPNPEMSQFYPSASYCSFVQSTSQSKVTAAFEALASAQLGYDGRWKQVVSRLAPKPPVVSWLHGIPRTARVLDVGCGNGRVLAKMSRLGFTSLFGIDPFLPEAELQLEHVTLRRQLLFDVVGEYDLVMFQHSLEHMPDHHRTLKYAASLLADGGRVLIRIPVAGSTVWTRYRGDWAQLDAPRHLTLHTPASMRRLAEHVGLEIKSVLFDSTSFQFSASELYRRGIPLVDQDGRRGLRDEFGVIQLLRWELEARQVNRKGQGDQAAFTLQHVR